MSTSDNEQVIAVDVGNNQIKLALFSSIPVGSLPRPDKVLSIGSARLDCDALAGWLPAATVRWCVATVHRNAERHLASWVAENRTDDAYLPLANDQLPLRVNVDFPDQVGADRLLAAVAVNRLRQPARAAIVVDAGSAITVDLVSANGVFEGGVILPGFGMSAGALARGTDLLPLVDQPVPVEAPPILGKSTEGAIRSGLFWGSVGAVGGLVDRISLDITQRPQLFVAGGDAEKLAPYLTDDVQVVPELVLAGIALTFQTLGG